MSLTLEDLKKNIDLKRTQVELPEFGGHVFIQALTAGQLVDLQKHFGNHGDCSQLEFAAHLLRYALVDENGIPLCSTEDDVKVLLQKSHVVFSRLAEEAVKVAGLEVHEKN